MIDNLAFFLENHSFELPAWETLPGEEIQPSPDIMGKRFDVLYHLAKINEPKIVIAPLQSVLQKVITKEELILLCYTWKKKDTISFDEVPLILTQLGYKRSPVVSDKGQFAVRGGIIDIFPVSSADAYRVEFFGDEIDNIRTFDPIGQKSIAKVDQFFFTPADEPLVLSQSKLSSVLDYLGENTLIVFDGIVHLEDAYVKLKEMPGMKSRLMLSIDEMLNAFKKYQCLFFSEEMLEMLTEEGAAAKEAITFEIFNKTYQSQRFFHKFHTIESFYLHDESEG
ncbi:MAG TPA: hypothetical protein VLG44_02690, partial [Chlamydiales bacterium]|nr:hypothetical protein [Chlamydiales bacterium]